MSSLSRGTWIEITWRLVRGLRPGSSLSRGTWIEITRSPFLSTSSMGRPSHEGRGLKYELSAVPTAWAGSSLSRGTWIEIILACMATCAALVVPLTRDVD